MKLKPITGLSEVLTLASTNPQYDNWLFIELRVQYKKTTSSVHFVFTNWFLFLFWHSEQFLHTTCSELEIFMYGTGNSMNNLSSYCGPVDARIRASDKDLPVHNKKGEIMPQKKKRLFIDKIEKVMFLHKQGNMKETQTTRHFLSSVYFLSSKENTFRFFTLFYSILYVLYWSRQKHCFSTPNLDRGPKFTYIQCVNT